MSTTTINSYKNKQSLSLGEILTSWFMTTIKGMVRSFVILVAFVCSPIWNYPARMRQLTRWALIALGTLIFLWVLFWLGQRPVFTIQQIQIEGANQKNLNHVNMPIVKTEVLNRIKGNFFSVRLDQTRGAFEELPWVRSASVRRVWPNGLHVTLVEREPVGLWVTSTGPKLIDANGDLFTANLAEADLGKNLVTFNGPENSNKEVLELYEQLNEWFKPMDAKVSSLTLSQRYSWTMKLDNGMVFEIGRDLNQKDRSQIKARLDRFLEVWPQVKDKFGSVDKIDLRYSSGFAIRQGRGDSKLKPALGNALASNPEEELGNVIEEHAPTTPKENASKASEKSSEKNTLKKSDIKKSKTDEKVGRKLE